MRAGGLAAALLAGAALLWPGPAEQAREAATDALMRLAPRPEAPLPVVLLALDEAALSGAPWPWPRTALGALVEAAARAGAAAVAIDIALADAAEGDAALAAALGAVPSVQAALAGEGAPAFGVALLGTPDLAGLARLPGLEAPAVGGAAAGFAGLPGNPVRGVPLLVQAGDQVQPGLALAAVARGLGVATILVRDGTPPRIQLGEVVLPLPRDGMLRLHPARAGVPMVSARGVAALPPGALAGRLAVIGVTAPEAAALRPSVFGAFTPSAVLQAEAAAQLAQGWVPLRPPVARWLEAAAALLLGLLAAFLVRRRAALGLAGGLGLALGWLGLATAALRLGPLLLDAALPVAAVLAAAATEAAATGLRSARDRARLVARFASRLPTGVADALLARPEAERLRPERHQVAVLITDLAGFSAMVRQADPAALIAALNAYLAGIEAAVLVEGGTLERLIGDSVLGVFGAPVAMPDHGARAVRAARAVDAFAEAFRQSPQGVALGWGETRIGVAAGEVLAGEMGGSRLTWAVCGDAANTAARLQELGKAVGQRVLLSGIEAPGLVGLGRFALRGIGEVEVSAFPPA